MITNFFSYGSNSRICRLLYFIHVCPSAARHTLWNTTHSIFELTFFDRVRFHSAMLSWIYITNRRISSRDRFPSVYPCVNIIFYKIILFHNIKKKLNIFSVLSSSCVSNNHISNASIFINI